MRPLVCYVNRRERRHGAGKTAAAGEREPSHKFRAARGIKAVGWVDAPDREGTDPERIGVKEVEDVSAKNLLFVQAVVPGDRVGLGTLEGREHHRRKVRIAGADRVDKAGGDGWINIIGRIRLYCQVEVVNPVRIDSWQIYQRPVEDGRCGCKIEIGLGFRLGIRVVNSARWDHVG